VGSYKKAIEVDKEGNGYGVTGPWDNTAPPDRRLCGYFPGWCPSSE